MKEKDKLSWPDPLPPLLWTVRQTAEYLGVPVSTLYY